MRTFASRIIVVVALLCAAGIFAAIKLPTAIFPSTDFPRIVVTIEPVDMLPQEPPQHR